MHQTKQWYFGMKAHIGVDAGSGLAHSLTTTAANASDVTTGALLHGAETTAWGDAGYQGVEKRPEHRDGGVMAMNCSRASPKTPAQGVGAGEG